MACAGRACRLGGAAGEQPQPLGFTQAELQSVLRHGPWPAPWMRDVSNRVSGNVDALTFGELLFFDKGLSHKGTVACATCPLPDKNWSDGLKLGIALQEVDRNTPSLANVRYNRWFGWDGGNDSLWSQSVRPFLDARELAASDKHVAQRVRGGTNLLCRDRKAFNALPPMDDEALEQFKVPGLRNVARTAPYMRNGHLATLREVVRHYSEIDLSQLHLAHVYAGDVMAEAVPLDSMLRPLKLSEQEISDVVAFLESLSERKPGFMRKPVAPCK